LERKRKGNLPLLNEYRKRENRGDSLAAGIGVREKQDSMGWGGGGLIQEGTERKYDIELVRVHSVERRHPRGERLESKGRWEELGGEGAPHSSVLITVRHCSPVWRSSRRKRGILKGGRKEDHITPSRLGKDKKIILGYEILTTQLMSWAGCHPGAKRWRGGETLGKGKEYREKVPGREATRGEEELPST